MSWLLTALLAFTPVPAKHTASHATTTTTRRTTTHVRHHRARPRHYGVTRAMMREVQHVNVCEEGGNWRVNGPTFFGGLGWLHATWDEFRKPAWPRDMADAPPYMQANAMWRFVWHYRMAMPDQHGCTGSY